MSDLRERVATQTEETLGRLASDLLENPLVSGAIARAFDARDRAAQAQELAMAALNLPSAADIERLTRRLRSVSQRLEGIEDAVDRLGDSLRGSAAIDARLAAIEKQISQLRGEVGSAKPRAAKPRAARKPAAAAARRTPAQSRKPR